MYALNSTYQTGVATKNVHRSGRRHSDTQTQQHDTTTIAAGTGKTAARRAPIGWVDVTLAKRPVICIVFSRFVLCISCSVFVHVLLTYVMYLSRIIKLLKHVDRSTNEMFHIFKLYLPKATIQSVIHIYISVPHMGYISAHRHNMHVYTILHKPHVAHYSPVINTHVHTQSECSLCTSCIHTYSVH